MEETNGGLKSCRFCAAQMPESAGFCPGCGRSMPVPELAQISTDSPYRSLAGALAYVTFIPPIVFLSLDRYRKDSFVRFHSVQCLLLWACAVVLVITLWLFNSAFFMIPIAGPLIAVVVPVLAALAALLLWFVLLVKAYQGERFRLPLIGDFAERYSSTSQQL